MTVQIINTSSTIMTLSLDISGGCGMADTLVIFEDNNMHPLSCLLRRGYRHVWCAVLDQRGHSWVGHDLRIDGYVTTVLCAPDYPLARYLRDQGNEVIAIKRRVTRLTGPVILNNCVGLTKTICGIRSWAFTPWQLRQHLVTSISGDNVCHVSPYT